MRDKGTGGHRLIVHVQTWSRRYCNGTKRGTDAVFVYAERSARDTFVLPARTRSERVQTFTRSRVRSRFGWRAASISPTRHSQFKFQCNFDDEPRGPTAISPLQVGLPVASSPPDTHPSSSIEKCTMIVSEWLSQLSIVLPAR
jgi:hypothetical protein